MSDPLRVRIDPAFVVRVVDEPDYFPVYGLTAREALTQLKADRGTKLLVTNGRLIEAVNWGAPIYPDQSDLLEEVLRITGGILFE